MKIKVNTLLTELIELYHLGNILHEFFDNLKGDLYEY